MMLLMAPSLGTGTGTSELLRNILHFSLSVSEGLVPILKNIVLALFNNDNLSEFKSRINAPDNADWVDNLLNCIALLF